MGMRFERFVDKVSFVLVVDHEIEIHANIFACFTHVRVC